MVKRGQLLYKTVDPGPGCLRESGLVQVQVQGGGAAGGGTKSQCALCVFSQRRWQMLLDANPPLGSLPLSEVFCLPSPLAAVWVVEISTDRGRSHCTGTPEPIAAGAPVSPLTD